MSSTPSSSMMTLSMSKGVCNYAVRLGGWGPVSHMHTTSCFNDTILVPLPTWILMLILVPVVLASRRGVVSPYPAKKVSKAFSWIYHVLIVAALAMSVLEITRLALSNSGVGLLPFSLVGLIIVSLLSWGRKRGWRSGTAVSGVLMTYWLLLTATQSSKVATLNWEDMNYGGKGGPSKYLYSDQLLDSAVILGLYAFFSVYEMVHFVRSRKAAKVVQNNGGDPLLVGDSWVRSGEKV